jgi:YjbR
MPVKLASIRTLALSLPETTEEPHHNYGSFRVRGKIFVTVPPGDELLHVFLPDDLRERALAMDPEFLEPVVWGSKVLGVRVRLPLARASTVNELVKQAHAYKSAATAKRRASPTVQRPRTATPKNAA